MKTPWRVVVVEDEPLARSGAVALLSADPEIEVVGDYEDGHEAIREIRRLEPDILFLDVQLRGMTGFDVLTALSDGLLPAIVFVTAFDEFAVRAFDVHAVDYLVKPYDDDRFATAVGRAKRQAGESGAGAARLQLMSLLETVAGAAGVATDAPVTRLIVRNASRVVFVRTDDVDWIEGASYYAKLHVSGRVHMMRETLGALERRLDPRVFFRVHRSAIVNLTRVQAVEPLHKGEGVVVLRDGTRLKLSRGRRPELDSRIERVEERR
jgi:two-component system LytT family response regulator